MNTKPIQAREARSNLGELLNQVYYQNKQFQIQRKEKPMAWLVSRDFIQVAEQAIDFLIEQKPSLADSLVLHLDRGIQEMIVAGSEELKAGQSQPLASILDVAV